MQSINAVSSMSAHSPHVHKQIKTIDIALTMTALAIIPHQQIPVNRYTSAVQLALFHRMDATSRVHFRPALSAPLLGFFFFFGGGHMTNELCHGQDGK